MAEGEIGQGLSRPELWARLVAAKLPGDRRPNPLLAQLPQESIESLLTHGLWLTDESARRLEAEYRRFLFLKAAHGGLLSPSKEVDQVWHLHLEAPGDAWGRFCDEVLECQVEHRTGLTAAESAAGYQRTLALYRLEFGKDPPAEIWPGVQGNALSGFSRWLFRAGLCLVVLAVAALVVQYFGSGSNSGVWTEARPAGGRQGNFVGLWSWFVLLGGLGFMLLGAAVENDSGLAKRSAPASCG